MSAFRAIAGTDVRDSDVDDEHRHPNTSDFESCHDEGIGNFGVFSTGKDALQAPNDEILGQKTPLSRPAASGRPPISSNSPDEFEKISRHCHH
jgi:hypothetical protein